MKKVTKKIEHNQEVEILRESMLEPEELFVLSYLKNFDRRASKAWQDNVSANAV